MGVMKGRGRRLRWIASTIAVSLVLIGCTGISRSKEPFHPTLEWGTCPADVEIQFISRHRCGWFSVLADRSEPEGTTLRLFVTETWPVGITAPPYAGSGIEPALGGTASYTQKAIGATRLGRIGYSLERRGTGHSEPSLACPESDRVKDGAAGGASLLSDFLDAVGACHDRLVAAGVDLADYDVQASVQDLEEFRVALGLDQWWNLGSVGSGSLFLFEYLREFPTSVRAAYLDTPQFPELDEVTGGIDGARYALDQVFAACRADARCNTAFPDLEASWSRALRNVAAHPLHGSFHAQSGRRIQVSIDAATLLRAARFTLGGDGPENLLGLPAMISAAAAGRITPELGSIVANDPVFCAGYLPNCNPGGAFNLGDYLSVFCRDEAPFVDQTTVAAAIGADPAYRAVFTEDPYLAACKVWDVPPADPEVHARVRTSVPLLILTGQFDSFSPLPVASSAATTLEHALVLDIPGQTHNVLGFSDCPIDIRNAWVRDPMSTPDSNCLRAMKTTFEGV
jgi:pimeloyl-ACP methyl ester carboxylesterase